MTRQATTRILEDVEAGLLDRDTVIMAALKYMSEDEVADMGRINEFFHCSECGSIVEASEALCEECDEEDDESL